MTSIKSIQWFKLQSNKGITFDIILTGIMLVFVILFDFLEKYMPWLGPTFKINISLIFIMIAWIISGAPWALILIVIRTIITPALGIFSYTEIGMYSASLLLFSEIIYLLLLLLFYYSLKKLIENNIIFLIAVFLLTTIISTIFLTYMNGIWMTPIFLRLFEKQIPLYPKIMNYYTSHPKLHVFLFGIPNYWAGIWIIMGTGNLLKFGVISLLILPIIKVSVHLTNKNSKMIHF